MQSFVKAYQKQIKKKKSLPTKVIIHSYQVIILYISDWHVSSDKFFLEFLHHYWQIHFKRHISAFKIRSNNEVLI